MLRAQGRHRDQLLPARFFPPVDFDLVYLPVEDRASSLRGIAAALQRIAAKIRRAFLVFLVSHDRPINELLTPTRKELKKVYADQFSGMTLESVPLATLEETRERLITEINAALTGAEREFLLSIKRLEPKWDLLGLPGIERLPGPQWKLYKLKKMDPAKRKAAEDRLRQKLGL